MSCDYIFKFVLVGESLVGKSSIMIRFIDKRFETMHNITIGVEFGAKIIDVEGRRIKLQIWDTAGQERFRSITRSYYRGAIAVLLVYDITNEESFLSLQKWLSDVEDMTISPYIVLIGNKSDLTHERRITYERGKKFAEDNGMFFVETSVKNCINIDETFTFLAKRILQEIKNKNINVDDPSNGIVRIAARGYLEHNGDITIEDNDYTDTKSKKKIDCC